MALSFPFVVLIKRHLMVIIIRPQTYPADCWRRSWRSMMYDQLSTSITRYAALSEEAGDNDDEDDIQKERRIKTVTQYLF